MAPPAGSNSVTVAELGRRFDRFESEVKASFVALHEQLRDLNFVQPEMYAMQQRIDETLRNELAERIRGLEQWKADFERAQEDRRQRTWTSWVAPVVTAVVAAIIIAVVLRGGS